MMQGLLGVHGAALVEKDDPVMKPEQDSLEQTDRALDQLHTIFDNAGVGIMYVHRRAITRCNDRLAQIVGYQAHELVGKSTRLFYENDEQFQRLGREGYQVLLAGRTFSVEMPMKHRDGHTLHVRATGSRVVGTPVESGDVIWVMEDVSDRWEAQAALRQAHDELAVTVQDLRRTQAELVLAEKLAALGSLVAGVAHELNTPVGNALTAASTLQQRSQDIRQAIAAGKLRRAQLDGFLTDLSGIAELVTRSCDRAAQLIGGFKQLAAGREAETRASAALLALVRGAVANQQARPGCAGWQVVCEVAPELMYEGYLHPLSQIVENLVENAFVHAFTGRAQGCLRIAAHATDGWLTLRFEDDGVGMDTDTLAHVFDPFFTTRLGQGRSGLGLAITRNLTTAVLGGDISARSEPGKGSCFMLSFPAVAPLPETH
jgi:PAS domain S-box-containing protein